MGDKLPARQIVPASAASLTTEAALQQLQLQQIELLAQNETLLDAQRKLKECRDLFANLFETTPCACLTVSARGQIGEINGACVELMGEARENLVRGNFMSYFSAADQGILLSMLEKIELQGLPESGEFKLRRPDGGVVGVYLQCTGLTNERSGRRIVIALTDVTSQNQRKLLRQRFVARFQKLTEREWDVLRLALDGLGNKEISARLGISQRTIETHRSRIYMKTGLNSLLDIIREASIAKISLAEIVPQRFGQESH